MNLFASHGHYYMDIRQASARDDISRDLSRHMPRRISVGPILVLTDTPQIFLSVIKKRLARMETELTAAISRTLDRTKKDALQYEISQLRSTIFTAKGSARARDKAWVCFVDPEGALALTSAYATIYVTAKVDKKTLAGVLAKLRPSGLVVVYGGWEVDYQDVLGKALA